jgi:uncharacterized protein (TIGR04141 family)
MKKATKRPKTRQATLYRLVPDVHGTREEMFDAFDKYVSARKLDEMYADIEFIDVAGAPAIWIGIQADISTAKWCPDASVTTGLELSYTDSRSGGVLLLGIDGTAYAMSYGSGYLLVPDELKDQRFGLRFVIRRLDSDQVRDLVRRRPDARGRTDSTLVTAGAPVWMFGIAENVEIIRRIGGRAKDLKVAFSSRDNRAVNVEGSVGLKMPFGVEPEVLVSDIRECERVCREEEPDERLAFIEWIQPVADATIFAGLDGELEKLLDGRADVAEYLVPVVPTSVLEHYGEAHSFTVRIGHTRTRPVPTLELEDFLCRTRKQRPGERVTALRTGHVYLNAADDDEISYAPAIRWLEANVSLGSERYFLMDGSWFQIGVDYVRTSRDEISRLFPVTPSVELPAWSLPAKRTEYDYNRSVAARFTGKYLCLDRNQSVRDPLGARSSLEICDLLGPNDELIHVKRAAGSAPLSHLFFQGLISAQALITGPASVKERFVDTVAGLPNGRALPRDFRPTKVVYAILMENGKHLTPDTLFPFSQVTLAHAARILHTYGIEVEVIGIPAA